MLVADVERLSVKTRRLECLRDRQIRRDGILHIDIVSQAPSVAADDRAGALKARTDRAGHDSPPVLIAPAERIATSHNRERQTIRVEVGLSEEIAAALRNRVRMQPEQ